MDRRKSDRVVVGVEIEVSIGGRPELVRLYDLSMDGCMIETSQGASKAGDSVSVVLDGSTIHGMVIWAKGPSAGVQFAERLDETVVAAMGFRTAEQLSNGNFIDQFGRQVTNRAHRNLYVKLS